MDPGGGGGGAAAGGAGGCGAGPSGGFGTTLFNLNLVGVFKALVASEARGPATAPADSSAAA